MRTNVHQNLEDEKAENRHFRIGPLPQYARVLCKGGVETKSFNKTEKADIRHGKWKSC